MASNGNYVVSKPVDKKEQARARRLKRFFNITPEEYEIMLAYQGGLCAICKNTPKTVRLSVDHNHKDRTIRGLLCAFCNRAVGVFRDDAERFERTVEYLRDPPATKALGGPRYGIKGRTTSKMKTIRKLNPELFDKPKKKSKKRKVVE